MHLNGPDYPSWKKDPQAKWHTAVTAAVCLGLLTAIVLIAAVCAAVNLAGVR